MKIWAHRGCSQNYPENTMTAFKKACAIPGLAGIETDIQISKDGHLMVFHDERVERTTTMQHLHRDPEGRHCLQILPLQFKPG